MESHLKFEKPAAKLEARLEQLRARARTKADQEKCAELEARLAKTLSKLYKELTPWQKVQVARHAERPHFFDYMDALVEDFTLLAGDRVFSDDLAIQGGLGRWLGQPAVILGHEKGTTAESRVRHNFGMARPEGYRKAIRLLELAEQFSLPVISLVDTAGAYPGIGAEERGQSEAIARCIDKCLQISVPFVAVIVGEGGSGGALALATASRVLMLEHAIYTVASPEACASILWRAADKAKDAAAALQLTAQSLHGLGVIDRIVPEPLGGAQRAPQEMIRAVGKAVQDELSALSQRDPQALRTERHAKYLQMGAAL